MVQLALADWYVRHHHYEITGPREIKYTQIPVHTFPKNIENKFDHNFIK